MEKQSAGCTIQGVMRPEKTEKLETERWGKSRQCFQMHMASFLLDLHQMLIYLTSTSNANIKRLHVHQKRNNLEAMQAKCPCIGFISMQMLSCKITSSVSELRGQKELHICDIDYVN